MTSSGATASIASNAALPFVNGKTSCPSARSDSVTIWTMVTSSSTSNTLAMTQKLNRSFYSEQARLTCLPGAGADLYFLGGLMISDILKIGKHADDNSTNDDTQKDDQQRLYQGRQARQRRLNFFIKKVCDAFEHRVDFAGLFAGGHHANNHRRENSVLADGG